MWNIINYKIVEHSNVMTGGWESFGDWFNLAEGIVWFGVAGFIFWRFTKNRKSRLEILYAFLFCLFGLTDFREIYDLPVWLFASKAIVLFSIIFVRILLWPHYNRLTI